MISILLLFWWAIVGINGYIVQGRFGHSAVQVNDSIYFYGGDSSVSSTANQSEWISDLAILPVHSPYQLTDPPWKPASGPQSSVGGPSVYSHIAFMGGTNNGNMIIIGGVMPQTDKFASDEEPTAYSYDLDLGRWNSFSLPSGNHLNRQGAACTTLEHGIAYIWGGKRAILAPPPAAVNTTRPVLPASMYRFDSVYPANSTIIVSDQLLYPPLRYAHTQTLISDHRIVVLGGFDGATGDAVSLADIWVFDITTSKWSQIYARLDKENKPANRSSHSQLLMPDGFSILVYGGYDGYHVYNDVAVLDTRTWTWNVKNTNAAVQGRADHTATLMNTNMIVAFGFTGVSTALTVMADIEVLDIITWSWTSVYTPSNTLGNGTGGKQNRIGGQGDNTPSSPSISIVAGAVTGGLVVFILILVAFYFLNSHHQKRRNNKSGNSSSSNLSSMPVAESRANRMNSLASQQGYRHEMMEITFKDRPSSTEPFEYQSRRPSAPTPHPLQINTSGLPTRSDTINTSTTVVTNASSVVLLPSPWSKRSEQDKQVESSDWMIRRAASTPTHHPMQSIASISKPDDKYYPVNHLRRAATVSESNSLINTLTNNSSTDTITNKNVKREDNNTNNKEHITTNNYKEDDDDRFDRQEFILRSDEVAKIDDS